MSPGLALNHTEPVILIAAHKKAPMPADPLYLPVFAGAARFADMPANIPAGYAADSDGTPNISDKNGIYCELSVIYWAWKHLPKSVGAVGLAHYRRMFSPGKKLSGKTYDGDNDGFDFSGVLTLREVTSLLEKYPVLLPKKRRYYIESNYKHYVNAHGSASLDKTLEIIHQKYPGYNNFALAVKNSNAAHMFNMFVMRRDVFDKYCAFLFDVLAELEQDSHIITPDSRLCGFAAELLTDVFVYGEGLAFTEIPVVFLGRENLPKKAAKMIIRKFRKNAP